MRFIELFAGIGGFRLGLERAGHKCVWANEIDSFASAVYRKNWPDGTLWEGDVRRLDPGTLPEHDLLVGGFPCQPVSEAGQRKAQDDARWLWPEIVRIFRATRPRWMLFENVPGLLSVNHGTAFSEILRDLADGGFDVEWDCLPAAAVGAPHIRYRVFIFANAAGERVGKGRAPSSGDAPCLSLFAGRDRLLPASPSWRGNWAEMSDRLCRVDDGLPRRLGKAYGNAVCPPLIEQIGLWLKEIEEAKC